MSFDNPDILFKNNEFNFIHPPLKFNKNEAIVFNTGASNPNDLIFDISFIDILVRINNFYMNISSANMLYPYNSVSYVLALLNETNYFSL